MSSVGSVQDRPDVLRLAGERRARVRVLTGDPFGQFARVCLRERPRRITIASPWVTDEEIRRASLSKIVEHATRHDAKLVLVTRPPWSGLHHEAIALVRGAARSTITFNPRLHGKLYVCESGGYRGVAVIGSANGTESSAHLDEIALLVRPDRASPLITELATKAVRTLSGETRAAQRPIRGSRQPARHIND